MRGGSTSGACALLVVLAAFGAHAGEPPVEPMLRVEARMHTAPIYGITADAAGRYLATGSQDKTVRVWEAATGRPLLVLRPPIGPENEGQIDAVAFSPDGSFIACGGWTGYAWDGSVCVYIFNRASGELYRRITGLPDVVRHLAFSPDGRLLAVALAGRNGIRVYTNTSGGALVGEDKGFAADCCGVAFGPSGRLAATCDDGSVRLYTSGCQRLATTRAPGGKQPHGIAFSPDGKRIAVGYDRPARVDVLSGTNLSPLFRPDTEGVGEGALRKVAWSADGQALYAAGTHAENGRLLIRRWEQQGRGSHRDLPASVNTITGLAPLRDGGVAFGAADPAFGVINAAGTLAPYVGPPVADYRDAGERFLLSGDGSVVQFGYEAEGRGLARFSISDHTLTRLGPRVRGVVVRPAEPPPGAGRLFPPLTAHPELPIAEWQRGGRPRLGKAPVPLARGEGSHCLAIVPGGESFLLGTNWFVRLFNRRPKEVWSVPAPADAYAANVSGDGRLAAVAFADGTIHWFGVAGSNGGRDLLTFFPHADRSRWIAWTASGFYLASLAGEELIGWHVNRGKDQPALFFPASHFRDTYCRPEVVEKVLKTLDEPEAVRLANEESGRRPQQGGVGGALPPVVRILSPDDGAEVTSADVTLQFTVTAPADAPPTWIRALVDGRQVLARDLQTVSVAASQEMAIVVPPRDCALSLLAENRHGTGEPETRRIRWRGERPEAVARPRPKVHVLAVGISDYRDADLRLRYADDDARAFVAAIKSQEGRLYGPVTVELLVDAEATRERIRAGLFRIQESTGKDDLAMVFFSGHGYNDKFGEYYFLPADVDVGRIPLTGVVATDILRWVERVPGTAIFFLDSCHAGNVIGRGDSTRLLNALWQRGAVVYTASTGKEVALEDEAWGNGAFTKALVEGLGGKAGRLGRDEITVNMLDTYLLERVKELTGSRQTPAMGKPPTVPDFPIALTP